MTNLNFFVTTNTRTIRFANREAAHYFIELHKLSYYRANNAGERLVRTNI